MPIRRTQFVRRAALASCVALAALSASAFAKDLPPSPDGAAKLQAFFAAYVGKLAPVTLEELSAEFGVSRERVRQIEVRAFEKVQAAVKSGVALTQIPGRRAVPALPAA